MLSTEYLPPPPPLSHIPRFAVAPDAPPSSNVRQLIIHSAILKILVGSLPRRLAFALASFCPYPRLSISKPINPFWAQLTHFEHMLSA
jgi:hypothetical protein